MAKNCPPMGRSYLTSPPAHARLRSPRGSPRKDATSSFLFGFHSILYAWCSKHSSAVMLFLLAMPFAYTSLHWNLLGGGAAHTDVPLKNWEEIRHQQQQGRTTSPTSMAAGHQQVMTETYTPNSMHPLPIVYVSGSRAGIERNLYGTDDDGWKAAIQYSKYTVLCESWFYNATTFQLEQSVYASSCSNNNIAPPLVIVDWSALQRECHDLSRILSHVKQSTVDAVVLVDTSDSLQPVSCTVNTLSVPTVRLAKAASAKLIHRHWDYDAQWIETGSLDNAQSNDNTALRLSGVVPEAFVDILRKIFKGNPPKRTIGVSHYWKASNMDAQQAYHCSHFRRRVSEELESIYDNLHGNKKSNEKSSQWVDQVGLAVDDDRESQDPETLLQLHATVLATSKIVIVVQSDEWEDSNSRLWEALASGAMVLADRMLDPPPELVHKTNIVWFDDAGSLQSNIEFYLKNEGKRLEIAKRGQQLALGRHRSWHVLEKLLFGKELTRRDKKPLVFAPPKDRVLQPKSSKTIQLY